VGAVQDDDAVVIFNFRADRVVEMSKALEYEDFNAFDRVRFPKVGTLLSFSHYPS
jgi:2,3-bisphosphoglycerate-independent phosphoglycerate mutase